MTFLEKIKQLPEPISKFLLSDNQRHELEKSCYVYGVDDDDVVKIAKKLGQFYVGELKLKDLPDVINKETLLSQRVCYGLAFEINKRIFNRFAEYYSDSGVLLAQWTSLKSTPLISEDAAWKKVLEAEPWIIENEKDQEVERISAQKKIDNIDIDAALIKYPRLGEQAVSNNPLKLRQFANSVRPSIRNWITDFHDNMGAGKHSSIDRGNYLFHGENGKKLTPVERRRLSSLLRSLDEKTSIQIDIDAQAVVFSAADDRDSVPAQQQFQEATDVFQRYAPNRAAQGGVPNHTVQGYAPSRAAQSVKPSIDDEEVKAELQDFFSIPQQGKPSAKDSYLTRLTGIAIEKKQPAITQSFVLPPSQRLAGSHPHLSGVPDIFSLKGEEEREENIVRKKDSGGTVSFSSPQKLPAEQSVAPAPIENTKPAARPSEVRSFTLKPQPQKISQPPRSQWHIGPTKHFYAEDEKEIEPKISGNVVDLKN